MRAVFYEPEEIAEAYHAWTPRLREYAAHCRRQVPLPDRSSLSSAHTAQYRLLCDALARFRDDPIRMPPPYLMIYHGSPLALLAASEVFDPCPESIVMLLSEELPPREDWLWFGEGR